MAVVLVALALAGWGLSPLTRSGFIQDDHPIVELNPIIHRGSVVEIFTTGYWEGVGGSDVSLYRPVTLLSFVPDRGDDGRVRPGRAHAVNLGLHLAVSAVLIAVALRLGAGAVAAVVAGSLFAVHPVHMGAVARLVGRAEILATLFSLLALWCLLWAGRPGTRAAEAATVSRRVGLACCGVCVFAALGSKEAAAPLPALLVLVELLVHRARDRTSSRWWAARVRNLVPLALGAGAHLAFRLHALGGFAGPQRARLADNPLVGLDGAERGATALGLAARYLRLLLYPHPLSADYSGNVITAEPALLAPRPLVGLAFLTLMLLLAVLPMILRRGAPPAAGDRSVAWAVSAWAFLAFYAMIGNLFWLVGVVFAERMIYLPSAAFCLVVGLAAHAAWGACGRAPRAVAAPVRGVALLVWLGVLVSGAAVCRAETANWKNEETLFSAVVRSTPESPRAHFTLGKIHAERGRTDEALAEFERTIELWPHFSSAWLEKALILSERGRTHEAIAAFRKASELNPHNPAARFNLALALRRNGSLEEAARELRALIDRFPPRPDVHAELGHILFDLGRDAAAADAYARAVAMGRDDLRPRLAEAARRARSPRP